MSVYRGVINSLPVMVSYLFLSFAYGVSAANAGLPLVFTVLMSVFVYAGSAQFIAVQLFSLAEPVFSIVFTVFIVNLRHFLLSSALTPYLTHWPLKKRLLFGLQLTDETFALHSTAMPKGGPTAPQVFSINIFCHLSWIVGSTVGFFSESLFDIKAWGLDYALISLFIALIILQVRNLALAAVGLLSAGLSLLFTVLGLSGAEVILSTLIAASVGLGVQQWKFNRSI